MFTTTTSTPRSRRSQVLRHALVVVAALTALLFAAGTASAANWQRFDVDADNYYDVTGIDRDGNGNFDMLRYDLDNDGRWDTTMYNTRYADTLLEAMDFDMDENNVAEARLLDGDQRPGFDYVLINSNQDAYWDSSRGFTQQIIPGSNVDVVNRSNRQNASSQLIHNFRMQTGTSLLYPSFPMPG